LTIAKPEIANALKGVSISTFGGNPVTSTAAKAVVDFIEEQNLALNAAEVGGYLRAGLEAMQEKHQIIGEVRGMGLLQALELVEDRKSKKPANQAMLRVLEAARENRILLGKGGLYGNVLRISPPMNIQKSDVDQFLLALDKSFVQAGAAA